MVTIMLRDGQKVTPWMNYQIGRLDHDFRNVFGLRVKVRSGIRTYEDQKRIFLERYVTAGNVRGRKVYDTRWWNGQLWYRISSAGTVAQPGTSNHEIQGNRAAVDLYDTGSDAGITVKTSKRGRWIRQNAWKYDLVASGDGFREGWHFDINNINKTPPGGGGGSPTPTPTPVPVKKEREDMTAGFAYTATNDKGAKVSDANRKGATFDTVSGLFSRTGWFSVAYANGIAKGLGQPQALPLSEKGFEALGRDLDALRNKS